MRLLYIPVVFFLACFITVAQAASSPTDKFHNGDLIFHQSKSRQAAAILEATGSPWSHVGMLFQKGKDWYVVEAIQPVRITPLPTFVARGRDNSYRVYRVRGITESEVVALEDAIVPHLGKNYDIFFEWSDDTIYCSELVYKTLFAATGKEIGLIQKFSDLNLNGPLIQELIRQRYKDTGKTFNPNEPIVTPVSQLEDSDLDLVVKVGRY
ncbi:MAG: hypothetical protein JNJ49_15185 [Bdellovibrionaceae bacterium]|nr:hypothetical protein [Pseudobdellovibrionaceae bacterium]